eukprot:Phypoly_transcript_12654.p1 GENE.Phypoly_transcript_12654~~Phypoly_transcript_12654.p1  ORF type:complete len:281 (+),score=39.28 Phypoly_transcript_12654:130-972(+)
MGACFSTPPKAPPKNPPKNPPKPRRQFTNAQGMDNEFTQTIMLPSYFYPGCQDWAETIKAAPTVGVAIINPNSGPGKRVDPNYVTQTKAAQAAGVKILGYVHTQYGKRDISLVQDEIEKFFEWYKVDGIFLDEIPTNRQCVPIFESLHKQISSHNGALTVLNPGTHPNEAYFSVADIICNFEDGYHNYVSTYSTPEWVIQNHIPPEMIWHIVHSIPGPEQLQQVLSLSRKRRAGNVFFTSEKMPNPYGKLPSSEFWNAKVADVAAFNTSIKSGASPAASS